MGGDGYGGREEKGACRGRRTQKGKNIYWFLHGLFFSENFEIFDFLYYASAPCYEGFSVIGFADISALFLPVRGF